MSSEEIVPIKRLAERPAGYLDRGEVFEISYPASSNDPREKIHSYQVVGWEVMLVNGSERIFVRGFPVSVRYRNIASLKSCDMGHMHPIYDGEPYKPGAPKYWGAGSAQDEKDFDAMKLDPQT